MKRFLDAGDIARIIRRLAHEILEGNSGAENLVLLGIPTRGVPLASRLSDAIFAIEALRVPIGALDVTLFRDDLSMRAPMPIRATQIPVDVEGRTVVLVDDVLYTGRTVRAAMDATSALGRPACMRLVCLIDRGHRELPIRADHVGKNMPTSPGENVVVRLSETDGIDEVVLEAAV